MGAIIVTMITTTAPDVGGNTSTQTMSAVANTRDRGAAIRVRRQERPSAAAALRRGAPAPNPLRCRVVRPASALCPAPATHRAWCAERLGSAVRWIDQKLKNKKSPAFLPGLDLQAVRLSRR